MAKKSHISHGHKVHHRSNVRTLHTRLTPKGPKLHGTRTNAAITAHRVIKPSVVHLAPIHSAIVPHRTVKDSLARPRHII